MCLGIPAEVKEVKGHIAVVDFGDGVLREIDVGALEDLKPGDLVIVHAGVAIEKIDEERAKEMIQVIEEFISDLERKAEEIEKLLGLEKTE
ncbi:HypC/HybG/HupF family hydrogenase formation chaperone [Pyrodictium abyssi]